MKITIDRTIWFRGAGTNGSRLLRSSDNRRCCLGILAGQCGVSDEDLKDLGSPATLKNSIKDKFPKKLNFLLDGEGDNNNLCSLLMSKNDSCNITGPEREEFIKNQLAPHGFEVEYIN